MTSNVNREDFNLPFVMVVALLALNYHLPDIDKLDMEDAEIATITHGHSLGYMLAAVLTHIINRIVFR